MPASPNATLTIRQKPPARHGSSKSGSKTASLTICQSDSCALRTKLLRGCSEQRYNHHCREDARNKAAQKYYQDDVTVRHIRLLKSSGANFQSLGLLGMGV